MWRFPCTAYTGTSRRRHARRGVGNQIVRVLSIMRPIGSPDWFNATAKSFFPFRISHNPSSPLSRSRFARTLGIGRSCRLNLPHSTPRRSQPGARHSPRQRHFYGTNADSPGSSRPRSFSSYGTGKRLRFPHGGYSKGRFEREVHCIPDKKTAHADRKVPLE